MIARCVWFLLSVAVCILPSAVSASDAWPSFRGENGVGVAESANLPIEFGENKNVAWKTAVEGRAWASPVVMENQVWVANANEDGTHMSAVCLNATTGKVEYEIPLFDNAEPAFAHPTNSYGSCTPTIEPGRVYLHFGHYGTACIDTHSGKVLWTRRDIECDEFRGPGSSPILFENLLIFNCDGFDHQFVIALDKDTGKTVWKTARDIDYGTDNGDFKKAYATPSIFTIDGQPHLVSPAAVETITYDPRTGKELWRVRHGWMNAAARPLEAGELILIAAGKDDTSLIAVKPHGSGDQTENIVWKTNKGVSQRPTPLILGDLLFMMADDGVASCRDVHTGELHWMKRVGGEYWASPVSDGKNIFCASKDGKVAVIAAEADYKLVAENQFDESFHATPAMIGDSLILRGRNHIYRIDAK